MRRLMRKPVLNRRATLAGFLGVWLLLATLLAGNAGIHHACHAHESGSEGLCVVCLLAHGQVAVEDVCPVVPAPVFAEVWIRPARPGVLVSDFDYNAAPTRAPPIFLYVD